MKYLAFLLLIASGSLLAQHGIIELHSSTPTGGVQDLRKLDPYFNGKKLIGLGESTHGTHEFFTMRHRLIKYLVENHGFNTIFMEADYANSLMINEYITCKVGSAEAGVDNLGLWPWETEELVALVEWLREYNNANPGNVVEFIGVDVQKLDETVNRLEKLLVSYDMPTREDEIMSATEFYQLKNKEIFDLRSKELARYNEVTTDHFTDDDKYEFQWLLRHLNQILSEKLEKKSHQGIYRDKMMAENILKHLDDNTNRKGIYWAHNGHIAYLFSPKKNRGVAGGYLKKSLGNQYFILGQEFDSGSFNARVKPEEYSKSYNNWKLTSVEVGLSPEGSFAANHRSSDHPVLFIPFDKLADEEMVYINSIGAIYYTNKDGEASEFLRRNHHGREAFDAMILIKKSTPTHLLKKKSD